jgi:hypothetical protein
MTRSGWMDRLPEFWHAPHLVYNMRRQSGDPLALPFVYGGRGAERQETDHQADLESSRASVGKAITSSSTTGATWAWPQLSVQLVAHAQR